MRTPAISLARLVAFVAVAEAGSFTAAAERLNTTKSAVSQAVAVLERELGVQLLQRSTRKLAITEAGESFLADCRALLAAAEGVMERAHTGRAQPSGTLRLTSTQAMAGMVAGWIATYREHYPAMRVDFVPTDRRLDLIAERFDLTIRIGPMSDSSAWHATQSYGTCASRMDRTIAVADAVVGRFRAWRAQVARQGARLDFGCEH
jgi:DNA-binding transcriptional LysR family regulator